MKKRILSVFLILAMLTGLFAVLPVVAVADTPTVWDGSTAAAFAGGDGTEANPYQISNGAELAYLAAQVNGGTTTYEGQYLVLTNDIVLNSGNASTWESSAPANNFTPIGAWNEIDSVQTDYAFGGNFNGDGHTISGLYINSDHDGDVALFGRIQGGTTIQNLALVNSYINSTHSDTGALVGQTNRASEDPIYVTNVFVEATIKSGGTEVGGIIGNLAHSNADYLGGKVTVDRATFIGSVSGLTYVAGIIGNARNVAFDIKNCLVYADVRGTQTTGTRFAAGIVSKSNNENTYTGTQTVTNCVLAGGSVTLATSGTKRNRAYISANSTAGGKATATGCYDAVGVTDCYNADDAECADISVDLLYGYYDGADAIDWTEWAANWASPADDIVRPKGVAENFDIALFTMSLQDGAAVRLADPAGLRFTAKISKNYLASFTSVTSYGIVIAPTAFVTTAGDFTMAALDAIDVPAGSAKFLKIEAEKLVKETGNYVEFTGVIANIKADNYAVDFSAIVYVEADGQVYYSAYDAEENSRSIRDIATAAYNDLSDTQTGEYQFAVDDKFSPYTAGQRAILNGFMG